MAVGKSVNIIAILRYNWKILMSVASPDIKYNLIVIFLCRKLFMLRNIFSYTTIVNVKQNFFLQKAIYLLKFPQGMLNTKIVPHNQECADNKMQFLIQWFRSVTNKDTWIIERAVLILKLATVFLVFIMNL